MQAYIPEFILAGLAMLLLLAETFYKKTPKFIFGLIGAAGTLAMLPFYMEGLYDNIYIILALVATAVTLLLSVDFRAVINLSSNDSKSQDGTGEFYILPLLACVGITSLCKASNLVELFVSLEVLTLSSFIMVGYFRRNLGSTEAGIKYLILGAVSTGFLVFGLAWYFGITGTFIYNETIVSHALAGQTAPAMYLALAMLLLGTAFKIGAVPMQLWIPDVYQGAPTPVTAFLSVASKVAGFALFGIILAPFAVLPPVEFVVALMAAATLLVLDGGLLRLLHDLLGRSGLGGCLGGALLLEKLGGLGGQAVVGRLHLVDGRLRLLLDLLGLLGLLSGNLLLRGVLGLLVLDLLTQVLGLVDELGIALVHLVEQIPVVHELGERRGTEQHVDDRSAAVAVHRLGTIAQALLKAGNLLIRLVDALLRLVHLLLRLLLLVKRGVVIVGSLI